MDLSLALILVLFFKEPIAPSFPVKIEPANMQISSMVSHWSDWKKVLNEWLEPSSFEIILTNDEKPLREIQPVTLRDVDENISKETKEKKNSEKDNYFVSILRH